MTDYQKTFAEFGSQLIRMPREMPRRTAVEYATLLSGIRDAEGELIFLMTVPGLRRRNQNKRRGTFNRRTGETTRRMALRRGPRKIGSRKGRILLRAQP